MDGIPSQGLTVPGLSVASQQLIEKTFQASAPKCENSRLAKSNQTPHIRFARSALFLVPLLLQMNVPTNSIQELPP